MEKLLWYIIAGTRGGVNRAKIIRTLHERPFNTHQLSEKLELDYRTVAHHLEVLLKNGLITESGKGYGNMYFLSSKLKQNIELFENIWLQIEPAGE